MPAPRSICAVPRDDFPRLTGACKAPRRETKTHGGHEMMTMA